MAQGIYSLLSSCAYYHVQPQCIVAKQVTTTLGLQVRQVPTIKGFQKPWFSDTLKRHCKLTEGQAHRRAPNAKKDGAWLVGISRSPSRCSSHEFTNTCISFEPLKRPYYATASVDMGFWVGTPIPILNKTSCR